MKVTITLDGRRRDPIPGTRALIRRMAFVRHMYNDMGEPDKTKPGAYEHLRERNKLLEEFTCIEDHLIGLAKVLGREAAEAVHIPERLIKEAEFYDD